MKGFVRSYFKVMQVIDMIIGIIMCITIGGLIFGIPLIISSKKFGKAYKASDQELIQMRGNLFGWGIFNAVILIGSIIGFIIVLCLVCSVNNEIKRYEASLVNGEEFKQASIGQIVKDGAKKTVEDTKEVFGIKSKLDKQQEQLQKLGKMKADGLITEEEYNAVRKKILEI